MAIRRKTSNLLDEILTGRDASDEDAMKLVEKLVTLRELFKEKDYGYASSNVDIAIRLSFDCIGKEVWSPVPNKKRKTEA